MQGKRETRRVVRDGEGRPVRVGPPLITDDQWQALQAVLDRNAVEPRRPRRKATLLLHVAWCPRCDDTLYYNGRVQHGKESGFYSCPAARLKYEKAKGRCPGVAISAGRFEGAVEEWFLTKWGPTPFAERVLIGGTGSTGKVEELQADVDELAGALVGLRGAAKDAVLRQLEARQEALEEALAEPVEAPRWDWKETGQTVAERWEAGDTAARRLLLLDFNVRANVNLSSKGRQWDPDRLDIGIHIEDPAQAALDAIAFEEEYLD